MCGMDYLTMRCDYVKIKYVILVFLFSASIVSSGMVLALTAPVAQDIIIQYGDSSAEKQAIDTIKGHTDAKIVSADSPLLTVILRRSYGDVFVVGHGSMEGIHNEGKVQSWSSVRDKTAFSSGTVYFVSCNSGEAAIGTKYIGISGDVDAKLLTLAYLVTYYQNKNNYEAQQTVLDDFVSRLMNILTGETESNNLAITNSVETKKKWYSTWVKVRFLFSDSDQRELERQVAEYRNDVIAAIVLIMVGVLGGILAGPTSPVIAGIVAGLFGIYLNRQLNNVVDSIIDSKNHRRDDKTSIGLFFRLHPFYQVRLFVDNGDDGYRNNNDEKLLLEQSFSPTSFVVPGLSLSEILGFLQAIYDYCF